MALTLSIEKRAFLDYIHSWDGVSGTGFMGGDFYLAYILDLSVDEAKKLCEELIKDGFLINETNKNEFRELVATDKQYTPLFPNMKRMNREYIREQLKLIKSNQNSLERDVNELMIAKIDAKFAQIESILKEIQNKLLLQ